MIKRAKPLMSGFLGDHVNIFGVTNALLTGVQQILADRFVGLYPGGSLALGGFDPLHSDIDFLVVTDCDLPEKTIAALGELHARIATRGSKWAKELEGSYIPQHALRRYDPKNAFHPHIERGGSLRVEEHDTDWVIQRHIIREYGLVLAGPEPKSLIDPVEPGDLRKAVLGLFGWWEQQLKDTARFEQGAYQPYAVLTMCRMLYTIEYGTVAWKPYAAGWAQEKLGEQWSSLIEQALHHKVNPNTLEETKSFIRFTLEHSRKPQ